MNRSSEPSNGTLRTRRRLLPTLALIVLVLLPVLASIASRQDTWARISGIALVFIVFEAVHLTIVCFGMRDVRHRLRQLGCMLPEAVVQPLIVLKGTVVKMLATDPRFDGADIQLMDTRYVTMTICDEVITLWAGDADPVKLRDFRADEIRSIKYVLVDLPMYRQLAVELEPNDGPNVQFWAGSGLLWGYPTARDSAQRALYTRLFGWTRGLPPPAVT